LPRLTLEKFVQTGLAMMPWIGLSGE